MENEYVKTTVENLISYLKKTDCGRWKQTQNTVEWRRAKYRARMRLVHGFSSDLEELLAIRRGEAEGFWIAFFEFYPGIVADERSFRRQTAQSCAAMVVEPCFTHFDEDEDEVVICASFPVAENALSADLFHMVEHISEGMISTYGDQLKAQAHGHSPLLLGARAAEPMEMRPIAESTVEKVSSAVGAFLYEYHAHKFSFRASQDDPTKWESVIKLGSRKVPSCISITNGLLKTELHLTADSEPLHLSRRTFVAQCFQREWVSCLPASVWIGNDDEPPMICAYSSLEGELTEKTLIALENCVVQTYEALIDVLEPVVEGFAPERSLRYGSSLRTQERLSCLKRMEELENEKLHWRLTQPRVDMTDFFRDLVGEETDGH